MTHDEIIQMARQAGWTGIFSQWVSPTERQHLTVPVTIEQIEAFAKLVAEAEREACVKECKKLLKVFLSSKYATGQPLSSFKQRHAVASCIESIEARGQA